MVSKPVNFWTTYYVYRRTLWAGSNNPTVRLRLDRLIQKIQISEDTANEPYIALIKRLVVNDKIDLDTAKILISEYKKIRGEK